MPTAKKLPSGSYRCQVFAGYVYENGKRRRKYESFTAPTKVEAELMASQWSQAKNDRPKDITVKDAVDAYIDSRRGILSPSTIVGYLTTSKRFEPIGSIGIRKVRTSNIQPWVSEMAGRLNSKTVQNTYGLLTATLDYHGVDTSGLRIKLPAKEKPQYSLPSDDDVQKLLDYSAGTPLWSAIMLARYYSLRRSEICALDKDDLVGDVLTIRKAMVMNEDGEYEIRQRPKTYGSYRYLLIDEPLLSELRAGLFVNYHPGKLSDKFKAAIKGAKVKPFNFHLLRHMFATKAAMEGIPDFYTAKMGGWEQNSAVLKNIYQNVRDADLREQMAKMNAAMRKDMKM